MTKFYLLTNAPRPDYRLTITFLWHDYHHVDSDGDSYNPASKSWTDLYCASRSKPGEVFEVEVVEKPPCYVVVESRSREVAARVALFLSVEMKADARESLDGDVLSRAELERMCGSCFDPSLAFERTAHSVWRRATEDEPYPPR